MEVRTESRFEQAKQDVSRIFASPVELCDAPDRSTDEKVYLLKQWETDLRLLLVASEENMPGTHPDVRFGADTAACRAGLVALGAGGLVPTPAIVITCCDSTSCKGNVA